MKKLFYIIPSLFFLTACQHGLYLANRKSGDVAQGEVTVVPGQHSGDISIALKGRTYKGRWVYMEHGGVMGYSSASAFSGATSAFGTSTFAAGSTQGSGTILASAPGGSQLRCAFTYNEWGDSGIGTCKTSNGDEYDLQIN